MNLDVFEENGILVHFFIYAILVMGFVVWAISTHQIASPMSMEALFGVTLLEVLILSDLSEWTFVRLITNKEVDSN